MSIKNYDLALSITDITTNEVVNVLHIDSINKYDYFMKLNYDELQIIRSIRDLLNNQHDIALSFGYKKTI